MKERGKARGLGLNCSKNILFLKDRNRDISETHVTTILISVKSELWIKQCPNLYLYFA